MGSRRLSAGALLAAVCSFSAPLAAGGSPSRIALSVSACGESPVDARTAERMLRSELEADGVAQVFERSQGTEPEALLMVEVTCDDALTTRIEFKSVRTGRTQRRTFALGDADQTARARALALAAAELVRAAWPEVSELEIEKRAPASFASSVSTEGTASEASSGAAGAGPDALPPSLPKPSHASSVPRRPPLTAVPRPVDFIPQVAAGDTPRATKIAFLASAIVRWFVDYESVSYGGAVATDIAAFRVRADVVVHAKDDPWGSSSLGSASLALGYRVFDTQVGAITVSGYPLASAGATWIRGTPTSPAVSTDPTTTFYGDLRFLLEARLASAKLSPSFALEVGRATGVVARAGDRVLGASGGFFLSASAGARY